MAHTTSFSYGDVVLIINGEYRGRIGSIVGMNRPEAASVYTVEFGDGSDTEIPVECLQIRLEREEFPL